MSRQAAFAGTFYEAEPAKLKKELHRLIPSTKRKQKLQAKAVIVPHAGYVYSGEVTGETLARVEVPETVVLIGPNHHEAGAPLAVSNEDWDTPLGTVPLAQELAAALVSGSKLFRSDNAAHLREHSLEVQLPFLQLLQKKLRIVPVAISRLPLPQCRQAGMDLAQAVKNYTAGPVLLLVSTDMSHHEPRRVVSDKDQLALGDMLSLSPASLFRTVLTKRVSMCGVVPVTVAIFAALELGADRAHLIRYTDSGYVSGDTERVVGYAGLTIR